MDDMNRRQQMDLAGILADINRLRSDSKPKHVTGHVLPDGRVILANGDIVDGIRGAPGQAAAEVPASNLKDMEQDQKLQSLYDKGDYIGAALQLLTR